ncbi:MAG: hypothetical protein LBG27_12140 [Spirochaetaceae bacterium]|nr:hypothetical protein [Spirochaetaceae bacterium]
MRQERELAKHVWYWVQTSVNISEPLFRLPEVKALFLGVLRETERRCGFDMRGLVIEEGSVSFSIKPNDGLKLPLIMQRLKQTFAVRLNVLTGRQWHVWGERYRSEYCGEGRLRGRKRWAEAEAFAAATPIEGILTYQLSWGSPRTNGKAKGNRLSLEITPKPPPG